MKPHSVLSGVKIGPYSDICAKIKKVGPAELFGWLATHDFSVANELTDHIHSCRACKQVLTEAIMLKSSSVNDDKLFDPAVCEEVNKHKADLLGWLLSIRETQPEMFSDASFHLGLCKRCPRIDTKKAKMIRILGLAS